MKCRKCGAEISESAKFCENCGAPIEAEVNETPVTSEAPAVNEEVVATAVEESARGIGDVAGAVSDMSENMKENRQLADENANIAQQLDDEVGKFKF